MHIALHGSLPRLKVVDATIRSSRLSDTQFTTTIISRPYHNVIPPLAFISNSIILKTSHI
jgi:hypothetical protein